MILGRSFVNSQTFVYIPCAREVKTYVVDAGGLKEAMESARAQGIKRKNTYPCEVRSPQSDTPLEIQPLIGTADTGLYLTASDIKKLGLRYTGLSEPTRQGICKIYSGVSLRFPADHNNGSVSYTFIQTFELPEQMRTMSKVDSDANVKRNGIIGLAQLSNHVVVSMRGDISLIDRSVLTPDSALGMAFPPLNHFDFRVVTPGEPEPHVPHVAPESLTSVLAVLPRVHRDTVVTIFQGPRLMPSRALTGAVKVADSCRRCDKHEDPAHGVKLRFCRSCVDEGRRMRALYCSKECQTADWDARHRQEHKTGLTLRDPMRAPLAVGSPFSSETPSSESS